MSTQGINFDRSQVEHVESEDYHQGELINGFTLERINRVDPSIRPVFDESKPSRSIPMESIDALEIGTLIDISYRKASNSVNTPYRIADLHITDEEYNERFDADEVEFKMLLEPVIQNASLVVFTGFERRYDNRAMFAVEKVYARRKWTNPCITEFEEKDYPSKFYDLGFEEKDRQVREISIVFDELIANIVGVEEKLVPIII